MAKKPSAFSAQKTINPPMKKTPFNNLRSVVFGLLCLTVGSAAQSRVLEECDVSFESGRFKNPGMYTWAIRFCDVREVTYQKWDAKLQRLEDGWRALLAARSAGDWKAYRVKWLELLPVMKELETTALANRRVAGAGKVLELYRSVLGSRLHQGGFGSATDLDSSSERILTGLGIQRAWVAADIGVEAVLESKANGQWFVLGLAAFESDKVVDEYRRQTGQRPGRAP
jgi:hypothetical protein